MLSKEYCEKLMIRREFLALYTLQRNGVVQCKNRTTVEMARYLLKGGGLPTEF